MVTLAPIASIIVVLLVVYRFGVEAGAIVCCFGFAAGAIIDKAKVRRHHASANGTVGDRGRPR